MLGVVTVALDLLIFAGTLTAFLCVITPAAFVIANRLTAWSERRKPEKEKPRTVVSTGGAPLEVGDSYATRPVRRP